MIRFIFHFWAFAADSSLVNKIIYHVLSLKYTIYFHFDRLLGSEDDDKEDDINVAMPQGPEDALEEEKRD